MRTLHSNGRTFPRLLACLISAALLPACTIVEEKDDGGADAASGTTGGTSTGTTGSTTTGTTGATTTGTTGSAEAGPDADAGIDAAVEAGTDGTTGDGATSTPLVRQDCWSGGDPHIVTFDGLRYDFQAVGEFVLFQRNGVVIQVRQAPWPGSRSVAMNTAVATKLGSSRVAIYAGATPTVKIDGTATAIAGSQSVGGGSISVSGSVLTIQYPTGEKLVVEGQQDHLDLDVVLNDSGDAGSPSSSPDAGTALGGLCSDLDGTTVDDFRLRNGMVLPQPLSRTDFYGTFASSWRIAQADSLFDYGSGESTTTFTDLGFPYALATTSTLTGAQYDAAYAACAAGGVTDVSLLNACVVDVAVTGSNGFVSFGAQAKKPTATAYVAYYTNDFEGTVGDEWSQTTTQSAPGTAARGATKFLGAFANDTVTLTLDRMPTHDQVDIALDLYVIGPWQGITGPDQWSAGLSTGETLEQTTFANGADTQSYPDLYPGSTDHPAGTGAVVSNALGITGMADSIYHLKFSFLHVSDSLSLDLVGSGLPADATWGIDNIDVSLSANPGVSHEDVGEGGTAIHVVHGPKGSPAAVGCSDGQREAFIDQVRFPSIAGCLASWTGSQSMRAASNGVPCGDSIGTCATPASACATGWHVCGSSGALADLWTITPDECESAGGGRYVAAISHCASQDGCDYNLEAGATYACYESGYCSESVCCGSECTDYGACTGGVWPGRTHIAQGTDQGCGAITSQRAGGVLCCKSP
jgi:hypothetical protein